MLGTEAEGLGFHSVGSWGVTEVMLTLYMQIIGPGLRSNLVAAESDGKF